MLNGHRDGETYDEDRDGARLNRQARAVFDIVKSGEWLSLATISDWSGEPEASVSARLRDLRKERFGAWIVERRYAGDGLWQYRLAGRQPPKPVKPQMELAL